MGECCPVFTKLMSIALATSAPLCYLPVMATVSDMRGCGIFFTSIDIPSKFTINNAVSLFSIDDYLITKSSL